jgi:hypothetical protein
MAEPGIALDLNVPFVRAVVAFMDGGPIEPAIAELHRAELASGAFVWRDLATNSILGCATSAPAPGSRVLELGELMPLLEDEERFALAHVATTPEQEAAHDEATLRLIGAAHLLIGGSSLTQDHFIRDAHGVIGTWSMRAWGAVLAGWANSTGWGSIPHPWSYVDFAWGVPLERGYEWADAVREVILRKTKQALEAR